MFITVQKLQKMFISKDNQTLHNDLLLIRPQSPSHAKRMLEQNIDLDIFVWSGLGAESAAAALFSGRTHSVSLVSQSESTAAECHRGNISIYLLTHLLFRLSSCVSGAARAWPVTSPENYLRGHSDIPCDTKRVFLRQPRVKVP